MTHHVTSYQKLCDELSIEPAQKNIDISEFSDFSSLADKTLSERLLAAVTVLSELVAHNQGKVTIDTIFIDSLITRLDEMLSKQIEAIVFHPDFYELESLWRSVEFLLSRQSGVTRNALELLTCTKEDLSQDLVTTTPITESKLYKHVYTDEYDTPGGEPLSAIVSAFEVDKSKEDMDLLSKVSEVSSLSHSPFIANVSSEFFNRSSFDELSEMDDVENYFDRADYIYWQTFRKKESSKYVGLCLPKFVIKAALTQESIRNFGYVSTTDKNLMAGASIAFAANLSRSFERYGWCVNICGLNAGGRVDSLIVPEKKTIFGDVPLLPTEVLFSESQELALSEQGFIPLSYYKNSDFGCFFSANSAKRVNLYNSAHASANAKINTRLPYVFLSSRIAHFLKVIQRENIGTNKSKLTLEKELNRWLQTLVTKMSSPSAELTATYPLKEGRIEVIEKPSSPGVYQMMMQIVPHFQIEGMDITLSLTSEIPGEKIV